jgi:hypothetical protein
MAVVNMATFAATRPFLPTVAASASGIAVAAIGNFILGSKLIFPARAMRRTVQETDECAA